MDRFWDGLNNDIQELLLHENCYPMNRLFCLAFNAEQKIRRHVAATTNKRKFNIPRVESIVPANATIAPIVSTTSTDLSTTSSPTCEPPPPTAPTQSESYINGNNKGTNDISRHDIDLSSSSLDNSCVDLPADLGTSSKLDNPIDVSNVPSDHTIELPIALNISCVEFLADLVTPPVLEDIATDLNLPCAQTSELDDVVSDAPIAEFNYSIDLCASPEIIHDENEPCVLSTKSDLDHIKLFKHDELFAKVAYDTSL